MAESFSFIRFAEYRPSTFTADWTIEIPTLAQFITDETLQPITLNVWLELTSLTIKNISTICTRLEEILSTTFVVAKDSYRSFPPVTNSFNLKINLLWYNKTDNTIFSTKITKAYEEIQKMIFKGLAWDLEKWILKQVELAKKESYYDPTRWNLLEAIFFIQEQTQTIPTEAVREVNLLLLSGWHTESSFEEMFQEIEPFRGDYCSWYYLLTIAPISGMTVAIADLLEISYTDLLVPSGRLGELHLYWKKAIQTLIEPIMEVSVKPTAIGSNYTISTNLSLFQQQKFTDEGFIIYTLLSQRYPIRINFLFELPVAAQDADSFGSDPVVLEDITIDLKTSTGKSFKLEKMTKCITYKLPPNASEYQPERELNSRMRRGSRLKAKLESILTLQSESNAQIRKMLVEPSVLLNTSNNELRKEQEVVLAETIEDLKLAFEIIDYLQEQELLLNELPPVTKMFKPPVNDSPLF